MLSNLVAAYGIRLAPEPAYREPRDAEWAYLVTGFSECIDSFFAFGLFELAKRSGFFPPELVDTFEPVIQEEARHILLFANWLAWHRRRLPLWRRVWFELRVAAVWVFLAWERIGIARGMGAGDGKPADNNFTLTGSQVGERRRHQPRGTDGDLSGGERPPLRRLRQPPAASDHDTGDRPAVLLVHAERHPTRREMAMKIKVGSEAHKELFCRQFLETHELYDPATLPWPELDDAQLGRLRSVPFWQEVYHTERRAGAIVAAFTPMVQDPLVREAVALQGVEEARHAQADSRDDRSLWTGGDRAADRDSFPPNLETAFIDFGFGECMDSFLGFGAFKTARQSEFLPEGMFEIFDVLMHEETRHIVFFINYMAWRQVQRGRGLAPLRALTSAWYYGRALQPSAWHGSPRQGRQRWQGLRDH